MTRWKSAPMKARKDIGEVVHPIEELMAARAAADSSVGASPLLEVPATLSNLSSFRLSVSSGASLAARWRLLLSRNRARSTK